MPAKTPEPPPMESDPVRRRALWIECALVLGIAVVPDLMVAIFALIVPHEGASLAAHTLGIVSRSARVVLPVLFVIWKSGDGWAEFGIRRPRWVRDILIGIAIWLLARGMYYMLAYGASGDGFGFRAFPAGASWQARPTDPLSWGIVLLAGLSNGFAEELAMRAFLIPRFERLWGSSICAVGVTTALTAAYHVYGGIWYVIHAGVFALLTAMVFCATRRLWPCMFAHVLGDVMPSVFR